MSQTGSIGREIEKHQRMREPEDSHGLGPDGDQAFEERDDLLYRRGGLQKLQPGDDADPAGDAVILQSHKDMGFVQADADGFSKEHWGHSRIEADGDNLYNRYSDDQYEEANKRYMQYHDNQIDYLRKMRDGGIVRTLQRRETGSRKRMRTVDGGLGFRELTGTGMSRQTGGAFVTPLTMSVADRLE
eukprot:COSAG02_NODE_177_length_31154_cov_32.205152_31_plen_187_part_00